MLECLNVYMLITLKQLKHFSVETESGVKLGHVSDLVLDTDGQLLVQYCVKPSIISSKEYLINRDQIVRFEDKKIIVEDNSILEKEIEKTENPITSAEPVAMRKTS